MAIKIGLDAGHYGKYNRSPANSNYYESDMTWKLHLLQKKYLEQYGFEVITTRSNQAKDLGVYKRGQASKGCKVLLSDHSNAVGSGVNESVDYPIVYYPINGTGRELAEKLADCIAEVMGTTQKGKTATRKSGNADYYGVIRGAVSVGVPGLIIEHGFHTNTRCTNWLLNDSNLDKLAKAEVDVIAQYYGVKKPAQTAKPAAATNTSSFKPYLVRVKVSALNIRKTPKWGDSDVVGVIRDKGTYTIVGETMLEGTKFGKLKSGAGWISVESSYVKKI